MIGCNQVDGSSRDPEKIEKFTYPTRLFGASKGHLLDPGLLQSITNYVFFNMPEVLQYRLVSAVRIPPLAIFMIIVLHYIMLS